MDRTAKFPVAVIAHESDNGFKWPDNDDGPVEDEDTDEDYTMTPQIGHWYRDTDEDETFQVTAIDNENGMIEIQFADGDIEEIAVECWEEFNLVPAEKS